MQYATRTFLRHRICLYVSPMWSSAVQTLKRNVQLQKGTTARVCKGLCRPCDVWVHDVMGDAEAWEVTVGSEVKCRVGAAQV